MQRLLYIPVNPKSEKKSTSKTVGREFVTRFLALNPDYELEELDLYSEEIPEINDRIMTGRAELVSGVQYDALSEADKKDADRVDALCDQFLRADTIVFAAPMWSISFPSRLKRYLDCILLNHRVIEASPQGVKGLLNDKERNMVYIQSSGGVYPKLLDGKIQHGVNYLQDLFKNLGVHKFEKILVEGVDTPDVGREKAIENALQDIENIVKKLSK